jgi:hypothetical protein
MNGIVAMYVNSRYRNHSYSFKRLPYRSGGRTRCGNVP